MGLPERIRAITGQNISIDEWSGRIDPGTSRPQLRPMQTVSNRHSGQHNMVYRTKAEPKLRVVPNTDRHERTTAPQHARTSRTIPASSNRLETAYQQLDTLGLAHNATWPEITDRFLHLRDLLDARRPKTYADLDAINARRKAINVAYATLKLLTTR